MNLKPDPEPLFERIHRRYRLLNSILSLGLDRCWRRSAVAALNLKTGDTLLDVGSGPGDMMRFGKLKRVVKIGLDPELKMLRPCLRFGFAVAGSAEFLPLSDHSVSHLSAAFSVRNFNDRAAAFREFHRVLRSGGRGAIIEFSPPDRNFSGRLIRWYIRHVIPCAGSVISSDREAYRYLSRTIMEFPLPELIEAELESSGFFEIRYRRLIGEVTCLYSFKR